MPKVLASINDLISANVKWGLSNRWAVELFDPKFNVPAPFDKFFPAESVDEKISNVNDGQLTIGHHQFRYPQDRISKELSITFLDDDKYTLMEIFRAWMDEVIPPKDGVLNLLSESIRQVNVYRYGWDRKVKNARAYWVYPSGMITYSGNQSAEFIRFSVELAVVKEQVI
ncbi:hypothetical protein phiLo_53 [Thermus phage phiLo]|nr:hypothetical protein phiLo_53 [Thermus phage phiLo]